MGSMKRLALLFSCSAALVCAADLSSVHNVYLLKMSKGLDQYLANRLTADHVFQIVTDPKLADAVLTDQIGENFQAKLDELYPPPEPVAPKKEKAKDEESAAPILGDTVNKLQTPASAWGRAKGTVFLVDRKSKEVVWSVYEPPKGDMDRTAREIVGRIEKDLGKKK